MTNLNDFTAICPNCDFHYGSGCAPFDPTYNRNLTIDYFKAFLNYGKAESICPRCEDPMYETDIYLTAELY